MVLNTFQTAIIWQNVSLCKCKINGGGVRFSEGVYSNSQSLSYLSLFFIFKQVFNKLDMPTGS